MEASLDTGVEPFRPLHLRQLVTAFSLRDNEMVMLLEFFTRSRVNSHDTVQLTTTKHRLGISVRHDPMIDLPYETDHCNIDTCIHPSKRHCVV